MMEPASLLKSLLIIFSILGFLALALWAIKKYGGQFGLSRIQQNKNLVLEDQISLGPKRHACVVRFNSKKYLLGVTDHHISLLDVAENITEQKEPL